MSDPDAIVRMNKRRDEMEVLGFKQVSTYLPEEIIKTIDKERKIRGLATRGHAVAAMVRELTELKQQREGMATG